MCFFLSASLSEICRPKFLEVFPDSEEFPEQLGSWWRCSGRFKRSRCDLTSHILRKIGRFLFLSPSFSEIFESEVPENFDQRTKNQHPVGDERWF